MWGMILKPLVGVAGDVVKGFVEKRNYSQNKNLQR